MSDDHRVAKVVYGLPLFVDRRAHQFYQFIIDTQMTLYIHFPRFLREIKSRLTYDNLVLLSSYNADRQVNCTE